MNVYLLILIYLGAVNLCAFIAFGIDKSKSIRAKWRISEATLISFAIFGGGIGCLLGMKIFRHKTLKPLFYIGIPAILIVQVLAVLFLLFLSPFKFMVQ